MFAWDDVRLFLAVAEAGSTRAAGLALGLDQTTVARRMDGLERTTGLRLFERTTKGFSLTDQGQTFRDAARPMNEAARTLEGRAGELARGLSGTIRLTAPESIMNGIVAPIVAEFRRLHPEVMFDYDASERLVDLAAGEADLAFRGVNAPSDDRLWGLKLSDCAWAVYGSEGYAKAHGLPRSVEEMRDHAVVAYAGPAGRRPGDVWLMSHVDPARVVGSSNTVTNVIGLLRSGLGLGALPCANGDAEPGLRRCFAPPPEMMTALWLLSTPERARSPRIGAFARFAAARVRALRPLLRGELPGAA